MIIRSQEHSYEAIQALPGEGDVLHYLGRDGDGAEAHLISMGRGDKLREFMPILSELDGNAAFTDLKEYFLEDGILWMIFQWKRGRMLSACLSGEAGAAGQGGPGEGTKLTPAQRFDLGRQLMEQLILKMIPVYLQQEILTPERVIVGEDGSPGFYYSFGDWKGYSGTPEDGGNRSVCAVLKLLFQQEEASGLYPEWSDWLAMDIGSGQEGLLGLYQEYLKLMPVFSTERKKEKGKAGFGERWKKRLPRIFSFIKIAAGLVVLAAAIAGAVGLWKAKVEPVIVAASQWKAVYVDGETLAPLASESSAGEETEAEPEPGKDPDNGRGERYRADGSLCYKGGLKDGLFDDTGTLYYPNGEIDYQGGFAFGKKEGEGCLYTDTGILFYEGGFRKDVFEGQGRLYDADTGNLVYEGGFSGGKYSGQGVLYDGSTKFPRYVGSFRLGLYDGQGVEYDGTGSLLYEGEFLLGKYHGKAILYDPATGIEVEGGVFRNGIFVGTEAGEEGGGDAGGQSGASNSGNAAGPGNTTSQASQSVPPGQPSQATPSTSSKPLPQSSASPEGTASQHSESPNPNSGGPGMTQAAKQETAPTKEIGPGIPK